MDAITQACEQHTGSAQKVAVKVVDILKQGIQESEQRRTMGLDASLDQHFNDKKHLLNPGVAHRGQLVTIIKAPRMLDLLPGETFEVSSSDADGVTLKHGLGTKFDNVKFPHGTYKIAKAQGVREGFDREEFRRHMEQLRAREELRKTDPVSAKALDLRGQLPQASKKKPEDDSMSINDPRHPGYAYTQAGQHKVDEDSEDDGIYLGAKVYHKEHQSGEPFKVVKIIDDQRVGVIDDYGNKEVLFINQLVPAEGVAEGEEEALAYATKAHAGQTRSGGDPYISHPVRVANHIKQFKQSHNLDALISAAYLHDTIEDTDTTQEILHDLFGGLVASLVKELTSDPEEIKKVGKAQYLSHKMAAMSSYALVIKLADRLDNVKDITTARTPQWRAKYAAETNQILNYIEKTRALSGTHNKLIELIRAKLAEIDNPQQEVEEAAGSLGLRTWSGQVKLAHGKDVKFYNRKNDTIDRVVAMKGQQLVGIFDRATDKGRVIDEDISRRGILKGIAGAGALGTAGKASAIAGAFPTPSAQQAMYKAAADSNRAEAKRQAELKAKADAERLEKNTQEVDREQRVNHHKLDEFAPGNGDDGIPHAEYQVYQCNPEDQFDWIGGPLYQTDSMGMAHKYAYEMYVKHRPKAFMVWQEHTQGSRGNYGVKGESDHDEDDLKEDYIDEK